MLLDDQPAFVDKDGLPSFDRVGHGLDFSLLASNFELAWCYSAEQMKELFDAYDHAVDFNPSALTEGFSYPNLIGIDYDLSESGLVKINLHEKPEITRRYECELSPFRGDSQLIRRQENKHRHHSPDAMPGFYAGIQIHGLLRKVASFPVPITRFTDSSATEFLSQFLDTQYGEVFTKPRKKLPDSWHEFLERGLPELRKQIVRAVKRGTMVPRLQSLQSAYNTTGTPRADHKLQFASTFGEESFRYEALFFDALFVREELMPNVTRLKPAEPEVAAIKFENWIREIYQAAMGPANYGILSKALSLVDEQREVHSSWIHVRRLALSADLADSFALYENNKEQGAAAIDTALDEHSALIEELGFERNNLRAAILGGNLLKLDIPKTHWRKLNVRGHVSQLAKAADPNDTDLLTRYFVIGLLIYAEFAWRMSQSEDRRKLTHLISNVASTDFEARQTLIDSIEHSWLLLPGEFRPESVLERLASGDIDEELSRFLNPYSWVEDIMGYKPESYGDKEITLSGQGSNQASRQLPPEVESKKFLIDDLLAPMPATLLLPRDSTRCFETNIRAPLRRLRLDGQPAPLKVTEILEGNLEAGGFRAGDGRIVQLFAAHFGFSEKHWPQWMLKSKRYIGVPVDET